MSNRFQSLIAGSAVLAEWLGSGNAPVSNKQGEARAGVCVGCPKNVAGDWWNWLSAEAVQVVRRWQSARFELNLETRHDSNLRFCEVCGCDLKTKIWVPLPHIAAHTSEEVWRDLPDFCWMRKEAGR